MDASGVLIPLDLTKSILDWIEPEPKIHADVMQWGIRLRNISCVSWSLYTVASEILKTIKRTNQIIDECDKLQTNLNRFPRDMGIRVDYSNLKHMNPELVLAIISSYPHPSFCSIPVRQMDIDEVIRLIPNSLNYNFKCWSPLMTAAVSSSAPMEIFQKLKAQGCNLDEEHTETMDIPNAFGQMECQQHSYMLLNFLKAERHEDINHPMNLRYDEIIKLFTHSQDSQNK